MYYYLALQIGYLFEGLPQLIIQTSMALMDQKPHIEWLLMISITCSAAYNLPMLLENVGKVYAQRFGDYNLGYWVDCSISLLIISPLLLLGLLADIILIFLTQMMLNTYDSQAL